MKLGKQIFSIKKLSSVFILCFLFFGESPAATVVQRGTAPKPASRASTAVKIAEVQAISAAIEEQAEPAAEEEPAAEIVNEAPVIENKSSQFDKVIGAAGQSESDKSMDERAEMIRRQRAALDSADATASAAKKMETSIAKGSNACDAGLRDCMKQNCGNDFSKCAGDGDTIWGGKLDSCKRNLNCSGEEFQMFATEIKADRDFNAKMASYLETLDCGNRYNSCIVEKCGNNFSKCIGKSAGDKAISDCGQTAKNCQTADSGLANRAGQVFATLRQSAEVQAKKDEERLHKLRDQMSDQCKRLGAMFDERSLDCVFTVNFFANNSTTPYASKKAYGGDTFDCDQNWFGIDITTFKENAYRLTRSQTAASSAMMGAGLGTAAGALTSGAIDRAMDRAKAEKAVDKAEKEHEENYGGKKSEGSTTSGRRPPRGGVPSSRALRFFTTVIFFVFFFGFINRLFRLGA
ncbi:MAG: hypothetical protein LBD50_01075, partial [Rickettsiales bacterium]|nr:hypothetical protein [Rickettsiales bacterium]